MFSWVHSCSVDWDLRERDGDQLLQREERGEGHYRFLQKEKFVFGKKKGVHWREESRGQQWRNALSTKVRPISLKWFKSVLPCVVVPGWGHRGQCYLYLSLSLLVFLAYNPQSPQSTIPSPPRPTIPSLPSLQSPVFPHSWGWKQSMCPSDQQ